MTTITSREELSSLPKGARFTDCDGHPMTRNEDGDFELLSKEDGKRLFTLGLDEVMGDYTEDGRSKFLPITVPRKVTSREEVSRDTQEVDTLYACPDGGYFVTTDGVGRYWYDSEEEADAQHGNDLPIVLLDVTPDD